MTETELGLLRQIAGRMIPASQSLGIPGADDPVIFAAIAESLNRQGATMKALLSSAADQNWTETISAGDDQLFTRLKSADPASFALLVRTVAQEYYRDDRIMVSLGMEPRPPFPKGYEVPEGDWSLLDPVRQRGEIWRKA